MWKDREMKEEQRKLQLIIIVKQLYAMLRPGGTVVIQGFRSFKMIVQILSHNVYGRAVHRCAVCRIVRKGGGCSD